MQQALRRLALLQHVLFFVLLIVCVARSLATGASVVLTALGTLLLTGTYLAGVARGRPRTLDHVRRPAPGVGVPADDGAPGIRREVWLAALTVAWLVLVVASPENVWIAFTLWLLAGHFFRWPAAIVYGLAVLAVVVIVPWSDRGSLEPAAVIGPAIGGAFALVVSRGQVQLVRDGIERQRLVDSLVEAQAQTEALHAELSVLERQSGALAERARLSRDIHDTLAQGFSSILLLARAAKVTPEQDLAGVLDRVAETAADNLAEARRVVAALAPTELEGTGLGAALQRLLDSLERDTGIRGVLRVDPEATGLPTATEVALLRTAQGALANVRNHSGASTVVVTLAPAGATVRLDVVDDGRGFDPEAVGPADPTRGGYGLGAVRARLRELGGGLEIESSPGEGTALWAHLPLGPTPPPEGPDEPTIHPVTGEGVPS